MEFRQIRLIIIVVSVALVSLIVIQVFWAFSAYSFNEKNVKTKVNDALKKTVEAANNNFECFELFSKVPINPQEGFYMVKQKWANDKFILNDTANLDTVPMFFAYPSENYPFRWNDIMFSHPLNLEVILKFRYLIDDTAAYNTLRHMPSGITSVNFRDKLSDNKPITYRYDTLLVDSVLHAELASNAITDNFHFGYIYNDEQKTAFASAGSDESKLVQSAFRVKLTRDEYFIRPYDLALYFDDYSSVLFAGMKSALIISVLVVAALLISFYLFVRIIYRQRKLSELKNDFINNMTHEFKTPLANISVALETLSEQGVTEQKPNAMLYQILGQETERLRENIERILQVARFEKERIHLSFEKIDIHQLIKKAVTSFEPVLSGRKGKMTLDFNSTQPVIEGDETHLINVVCNLVDNAIKYSPNGLHIYIATKNHDEGVVMTVKDSGKGISRNAQKKIFEKFYRGENGDVHDVKGFGLGLTYVKTIVDSHGGKITVKSQTGEGSEFEVYLPFKS